MLQGTTKLDDDQPSYFTSTWGTSRSKPDPSTKLPLALCTCNIANKGASATSYTLPLDYTTSGQRGVLQVSFQQNNDDQVRPTFILYLSRPPSLLKTNLHVGTKRKGWATSYRAKKTKTKQLFADSAHKTFLTS